jgi:hypothetical protein
MGWGSGLVWGLFQQEVKQHETKEKRKNGEANGILFEEIRFDFKSLIVVHLEEFE